MITKLLKHEAIRTRGLVLALVGGALAIVAVSALLIITKWPVLSQLGIFIGAAVTLMLIPVAQFALAVDYWRSSYRANGYLTHSLPARGSTVFAAKLIWASIITIVAIIVTLALILMLYPAIMLNQGGDPNPFTALGQLGEALSTFAPAWLIVLMALGIVVFYLSWPVQLFYTASRGSEEPINRRGAAGPIIVYAILYTVTQVLSAAAIFALPFGLGMDGDKLGIIGFDPLVTLTNDAAIMPIGFLPVIFVITLYCLWRTVRSWNRHVSLV